MATVSVQKSSINVLSGFAYSSGGTLTVPANQYVIMHLFTTVGSPNYTVTISAVTATVPVPTAANGIPPGPVYLPPGATVVVPISAQAFFTVFANT